MYLTTVLHISEPTKNDRSCLSSNKDQAILQPLDKGTIHSLKTSYRIKLLEILFTEEEKKDKNHSLLLEKVDITRATLCTTDC